jgi:lipoprotein NlpI
VGLDEGKKAANEFALALAIDRRNDAYYHSRSFTYLRLRRGSLAATAARFALELGGWHDEASLYMVLTGYFGERMAHNDEVAAAALKEAQSKVDQSLWPYPVVQYLLNEISAQDLLKRATDNDKQTEVHSYLGLSFSLAEKREGALEQLRWVKEHGNKDFSEYRVALAELERLEQSKAK